MVGLGEVAGEDLPGDPLLPDFLCFRFDFLDLPLEQFGLVNHEKTVLREVIDEAGMVEERGIELLVGDSDAIGQRGEVLFDAVA